MKKKLDKNVEIEQALAKHRAELEAKFSSEEKIVEVSGGMESLLNKQVLILCAGYFYEGKLTGVNSTFVQLEDAVVVYNPETLSRDNIRKCLRDKLPAKHWYIERGSIESYGEI